MLLRVFLGSGLVGKSPGLIRQGMFQVTLPEVGQHPSVKWLKKTDVVQSVASWAGVSGRDTQSERVADLSSASPNRVSTRRA